MKLANSFISEISIAPLAGWLVSQFGWPWPFFVLGTIGFIAAIAWIYFMHEPREHPKVSQAELTVERVQMFLELALEAIDRDLKLELAARVPRTDCDDLLADFPAPGWIP